MSDRHHAIINLIRNLQLTNDPQTASILIQDFERQDLNQAYETGYRHGWEDTMPTME